MQAIIRMVLLLFVLSVFSGHLRNSFCKNPDGFCIPFKTFATDLGEAKGFQKTVMPERLPCIHIADVHLHRRKAGIGEGIRETYGCVAQATAVDDNSGCSGIFSLKEINDGAFMIGLKIFELKFRKSCSEFFQII